MRTPQQTHEGSCWSDWDLQEPQCKTTFFFAAPELSCLAKEFKDQFLDVGSKAVEHHDLSPSKIKREHGTISRIKDAIQSHGNPFAAKGNMIYNIITHACMPDENIYDTGQKLYEDYVAECINGDVSLWAPVKKQNNKMYMSGNKSHKFKIRNKIVDLKETKDVYGSLMVLARSNRVIDQKQAVGIYEFTLTPRALFSPNCSVLPCNDKSNLIHVLEKLTTRETTEADQQSDEDPIQTDADPPDHRRKIAVVDGMVRVQKMTTKPATVVTVKDLSVCFNDRLMILTRNFYEVILVFDTYKADSLKSITRKKRRKGKDPVQYQVRDETSIRHITMSRFLSHEQTKADLTEYLAEKTLDYNKD